MRLLITKLIATAASAALVATPAMAEKASELGGLNGSYGRDGERALRDRGFSHVSTHKQDRGYVYSYWWDEADDDCVNVEVYDGRITMINDASDQDCGHHTGNAGTAVAAVAGAAILGALLSHKSHHHEDKRHHSSVEDEQHYERGFTDGLHNAPYHNYDRSNAYSNGYQAGVAQRRANLSHHSGHGGYAPASRAPTPGSNERAYYDDGCRAGTSDARASMSMYHGRHSNAYDSRFEPYFRSGYEDCWRKNR